MAQSSASELKSCTYGDWSSPTPLAPGSIFRFPSAAVAGGSLVVVGADLEQFDGTPVGDSTFRVWRASGELRSPPVGGRWFAYPLVIAQGNGSLRMFWGESDSLTMLARVRYAPTLTRLMTSTLSDDGRWDSARVVAEDSRGVWDANRVSSAALSPSGTMHLAVPTSRGLLYIRISADSIKRDYLVDSHPVSYASTAIDVLHGTVGVAFVSAASGTRSDFNSLFFIRSTDGGDSWSAAQVVERSGDQPAFESHLLADSGRFTVLWSKDTTGDTQPEEIRVAFSKDGGHIWTPGPRLPTRPGIHGTKAVQDGCAGVHVAFEDWAGRGVGGYVRYARLSAGKWSVPGTTAVFRGMVSPSLAMNERGHVTLVATRMTARRTGTAFDGETHQFTLPISRR